MIIADIREAMGLSQQEFAAKLGISFSTVNRWENGRNIPNKLAQNAIYELAKSNNISVARMVYNKILAEANSIKLSSGRILLYHGSKSGIKGEIAPLSREHCDFGKGFYMGNIPEQPLTLVCDYEESCFYIVSIDMTKLKQITIAADINWAMLVALKRGKLEDVKDTALYHKIDGLVNGYDVIIGSIANDRMFYVLDNFFLGNITDQALIASLSALNMGQQVVAITQKACDTVKIEKQIELSYLERIALKEAAEINRLKGKSLANDICKTHRREGLFFDEILQQAKGAK